MLEGLPALGDYRILLMPDHRTPLEIRTHSDEPVPFVLYDSREDYSSGAEGYTEAIGNLEDSLIIKNAHELMGRLINHT